jgi:OOP family OmpA-OmpF porin
MGDGNGGSPLDELRSILVGPAEHRLEELEERLEHAAPEAEEVSRILPAAVTLSTAQDNRLGVALTPLLEDAIRTSVRRNPQPLADAIFPVIGPAIRKAIAAALGNLVQTMNQALEHTFSIRGLRWRAEALRTGVSFGEIVLRKSLVFRVEQLFLVHREGGLLLQHVSADSLKDQSPEMIAGMLTAIQDFARDSFHVGSQESLETMQVGELVVLVEEGPRALLAAVIRGIPPGTLRTELQQALEMIHAVASDRLLAFDGDASTFTDLRPLLERCLRQELAPPPAKGRWPFWILTGALLALLAWWIIPLANARRQWDRALDSLRAAPGIIVTDAGRKDGRPYVTGLRDPGAPSTDTILKRAGINPGAVGQRWESYYSLDPALALTRVKTILSDDIVAVERQSFFYPAGVDVLPPQQAAQLPALARRISTIGRTAAMMGLETTLTIVGQTDETGERDLNARLGQARADQVSAALAANGAGVTLRPIGAAPPAAGLGTADSVRAERRRVSFTVDFTPRTSAAGWR